MVELNGGGWRVGEVGGGERRGREIERFPELSSISFVM